MSTAQELEDEYRARFEPPVTYRAQVSPDEMKIFQARKAAQDQAAKDRRERIATAALQGLCANPAITENTEHAMAHVTQASVRYADALIAELDKEAQP